MPGGRGDAVEAERREVRQVVRVPALQAEHDEQHQHAELDQHHHRVDLRRLARAADQQQRAQPDQDHGRQVEDAALLGRLRQALGDREAEQVVEQLVEVLRPADGDRRRGRRRTRAAGTRRRPSPRPRPASRRRRSTTSRRPARRSPARRNRSRSGRRPMPANTNDQITAGPATGTACVSTMKMPVPIVAPMPNIDSWNSPIERASSPSPVSVPVSAVIAVTGLRRRTCSRSDGLHSCHLSPLVSRRRARAGRPRSRAAPRARASPVAREDHRDPAVAVVVVGHRVAVGARGRDGEQVADARRRRGATPSTSTSPLSQWRPTTVTARRRRRAGRRSPPRSAGRTAPTSRLSPMPPSTATNVIAALDA